MRRWIAIDYGTKKIGLAVADLETAIATPLKTIPASGSPPRDVDTVLAAARDYQPDGYVVGLPLNMDGSTGPQANFTLKFVAALKAATCAKVETWDERLSSFAADELANSIDKGETSRKSRPRDALAAQQILIAFLNGRQPPSKPPT